MSNDSSSGMTGLKDFSVEAQRRMFMEQQEKERAATEARRQTRKFKAATAAGGASGVVMSGMMSNMENSRPRVVGDDDDDSIGDDYSIGSEESFYVGIERADYAQPDNFEIYGEEKEDLEEKESRLGISRVSVKFTNREGGGNGESGTSWDADIPIHSEKSSSLYELMNGSTSAKATSGMPKKVIVVAKPLIGSSLDWKVENKLEANDDGVEQVYEREAAEGKFFINKLVGTAKESRGVGLTVDVSPRSKGESTAAPSAPGDMPTLSPMALFSPIAGATTDHEDNAVRQMRERELKKDALANANKEVLAKVKQLIAANKDGSGKVYGVKLTSELEKLLLRH